MLFYIIYLPLLLIIILVIRMREISIKGIIKMINIMMIKIIIITIIYMYEIYKKDINYITIKIKNIINDKLWESNMIIIDKISIIFILMIISISWLIIIYSYEYMKDDPHINRFILYIIMFIWGMLIIILNNNYIIIFIGWEGIGIISYLLITYWTTRYQTNIGGLIAILMNRVGDIIIIIGIIISNIIYKSIDIIIINIIYKANMDILLLILIIGSLVKSAQIYYHIWLPYSMEGYIKD